MVLQPITDEAGNVIDEFDDKPMSAPPSQPTLTAFDSSEVFIGITLHQADGHPQGRLVSVCIHNHSGVPTVRAFREQELTTESRLDNLQSAIQATMQPFLLELATRKPEKAVTSRPATTPTKPTAPPVKKARLSPAEKVTKPQSNYEQVSMF